MSHLTKKKWVISLSSLLLLLIAVALLSLDIGSERIDFFGAITGADPEAMAILFSARLPRIILALLVGIALSSAGGTYQSLLRNSLADPFILGVSGGAALGSVLAVAFSLPFFFISVFAFAGSLFSMLVIFSLAKRNGRLEPHTLLLTGVVFNAFSFALILFINAVVTMEQAYQILFLLMGNIESTDYSTLLVLSVFVVIGFVTLCLISGRMNVISLGDDEALQLGVDAGRMRTLAFFSSSLMVGAAVAATGLIGFVGMFVPHAVRLVFGSDNRLLIPASGLIGGIFLIVADTLARTILMTTGYNTLLPVGVITALIGGPVFALLLKRSKMTC